MSSTTPPDDETGEPTSTLLVTIDSLRYDYFDHLAQTREFLDEPPQPAFATSTATAGSFQSIIAGEYPDTVGVEPEDHVANHVPHECRVGRTTNHLLSDRYGYDAGFTQFTAPSADTPTLKERVQRWIPHGSRRHALAVRTWNGLTRARTTLSGQKAVSREYDDAADVIAAFLDTTSTQSDDHWFGWLHFMEPHYPYNPTNGSLERVEAQALSRRVTAGKGTAEDIELAKVLYTEEIAELDSELATLWDAISADTRVILCADHGELFGEYEQFGHPGVMAPELLRVPFATKNIPHPTGDVISLIDVPTLLLGHEHGYGTTDRDTAYATYGDVKAACSATAIATPDSVVTLDGQPTTDAALSRAVNRFTPAHFVNEDALLEDLEQLGYA
jgi:hypothetical protein